MDNTLIDPRQIKPTKEGYENLNEQLEFGRFNSVLTGAAPTLFEEFVSQEGQRLFKLTASTYIVGDHSLQVFVNGQLMRVGLDNDYIEVDNTHIEFCFGLDKDDVVVLRVNGGKSGPSLHEIYRAVDGQVDFTLASSYSTDNDSLLVFINGAYQTLGIDYNEVDSKNVQMIEPLEENDIVVFRVEGLPAEMSSIKSVVVNRTFDSRNHIIKEETVGDGVHIIQEYYRDANGRPERCVIRQSGFTTTKTYIWENDNCIRIEVNVVEGT